MDSDLRPAGKNTQSEGSKKAEGDVFRTPEEVATDDGPLASTKTIDIEPAMRKKTKTGWKDKLTLHWPPGRKEWLTALALVLLIGGGIGVYALTHQPPPTIKPIPKVTPKTKTVPSTLTGLPVDPSVNKRTVTGVMIENSLFARPQSGLGQAGVVFEAIAEGGITRFLALYQDTAPADVGPIRSSRPYYLAWNLGFDAGYAHVGGSPEALADIRAWHVRDLDQFGAAGYYHRIDSREAPHNVYTSIATLNQLEVKRGFVTSDYTGFARKKKASPHRPKSRAVSIKFTLSGPNYDVHYNYSPKTNSYARNEGGAPHIDAGTHKQISPTVVVALVMPYSLDSDGYHSSYSTIGDGPLYVFQDGDVIKGRWYKTSRESQFTFKDTTGKTIKLNPGYTWLTALAGTDRVSYTP